MSYNLVGQQCVYMQMNGTGITHQGCDLTKNSNVGETWCELAQSVGEIFGNNTACHTADDTGRQAKRNFSS